MFTLLEHPLETGLDIDQTSLGYQVGRGTARDQGLTLFEATRNLLEEQRLRAGRGFAAQRSTSAWRPDADVIAKTQ